MFDFGIVYVVQTWNGLWRVRVYPYVRDGEIYTATILMDASGQRV
jgi:hypothetical protein